MSERRSLSDREVADLVTRLRALRWSWDPAEAERLVEAFGGKVGARIGRSWMLNTGFGIATGNVHFSEDSRVERVTVAVCEPRSEEPREEQAWLQDTFAQMVATAVRALGDPTQRVPGETPEVRWRGEDGTVGVMRSSVQVNIFLATNQYIDDFDWAVSQGL